MRAVVIFRIQMDYVHIHCFLNRSTNLQQIKNASRRGLHVLSKLKKAVKTLRTPLLFHQKTLKQKYFLSSFPVFPLSFQRVEHNLCSTDCLVSAIFAISQRWQQEQAVRSIFHQYQENIDQYIIIFFQNSLNECRSFLQPSQDVLN